MKFKITPGPWRVEPGGGHAPNKVRGSADVQVNGWLLPIGDMSNASYSDRICENLGDLELPTPSANALAISRVPKMLEFIGLFANVPSGRTPDLTPPMLETACETARVMLDGLAEDE